MIHPQDRELAASSIKALTQFTMEFEGSKTKPNVVFMNDRHYNAISKCFPYMIDGLKFKYNNDEYRIVITRDTAIGMAFTFFTDYVHDYK
jgi:hypothetical protein